MSTLIANVGTAVGRSSRFSATQALARKEWSENRSIVASMMALTVIVFLVPVVWTIVSHSQSNTRDRFGPVPVSFFIEITPLLWILSGAICGASIAAPEVGKGSLQLLATLPITSSRIWWTKLRAGVSIMLTCMVVIPATFALLSVIGAATKLVVFDDITRNLVTHWYFQIETPAILAIIGVGLFALAVGAVVTMLTDRIVTAIVVTLLAGSALSYLLVVLFAFLPAMLRPSANYSTFEANYITLVIGYVLAVVWLLSMSHAIFTKGEMLRTRKRFLILKDYLLPPIFILGALALGTLIIISWIALPSLMQAYAHVNQ